MSCDPDQDREREAEAPEEKKPNDKGIPPLPKKVPEPPDELRRREEWFRKRSE